MATVESTWVDNGLKQASVDLSCPAERIQFVVEKRRDGTSCNGSEVAAHGCGKELKYACKGRTWQRAGQVMEYRSAPNEPLPPRASDEPDAGL
jgi:hypothetical protein